VLAFGTALAAGVDDIPENNDRVRPWLAMSGAAFVAALGLLAVGVLGLRGASGRHASRASIPSVAGYLAGIVVGLLLTNAITGAATGSGDAVSGIVLGLTVAGLLA
jgi:hypothetical protein